MLYHYGDALGQTFNGAKGIDNSFDIAGWFKGCKQKYLIEEIK